MLTVEQYKGGFDGNFSYLVYDETKQAAIFDASVDPQIHLERAKQLGLTITFVFVMHSHRDHLVGLEQYRAKGIPIYGHTSLDYQADATFEHKDTLHVGKTEVQILHAPGHRFDCVLLHGDEKVFTTDVLFVGGCGRCDLQGSEPEKMYHSLYEVFGSLPDATVVYPGHDYGDTPTSTVGQEKATNPYLTCNSKEEFLRKRMGI